MMLSNVATWAILGKSLFWPGTPKTGHKFSGTNFFHQKSPCWVSTDICNIFHTYILAHRPQLVAIRPKIYSKLYSDVQYPTILSNENNDYDSHSESLSESLDVSRRP